MELLKYICNNSFIAINHRELTEKDFGMPVFIQGFIGNYYQRTGRIV